MEGHVNYKELFSFFFFHSSHRRQRKSRSRRLLRRLITLIFAGRNRIIVIRRELPRTSDAGSVRRPTAWSFRGFSFPCASRPPLTLPLGKFLLHKLTSCRPPFARLLRSLHSYPNGPDKPNSSRPIAVTTFPLALPRAVSFRSPSRTCCGGQKAYPTCPGCLLAATCYF